VAAEPTGGSPEVRRGHGLALPVPDLSRERDVPLVVLATLALALALGAAQSQAGEPGGGTTPPSDPRIAYAQGSDLFDGNRHAWRRRRARRRSGQVEGGGGPRVRRRAALAPGLPPWSPSCPCRT
jgi:hypothetical protein